MVSQQDTDYLNSQKDPSRYNPVRIGSLKTLFVNPRFNHFIVPTPEKAKEIYDGELFWVPSDDKDRASVGIIYVQTLDGKAAFKAPWKAKGGVTDWYHFREILRVNIDGVGAANNMRRGENDERPLLLSFYDPDLIVYRESMGKQRHPLGIIVTGSGEIKGGLDHLVFNSEGESVIFTSDQGIPKLENLAKPSGTRISIESIGPSPRELDMKKMLTLLKSKYHVDTFLVLGGPGISTELIKAGLVDNYFINISGVISGNPDIRSFFHMPEAKELRDLELVSIKMAGISSGDEGRNTVYLHYTPKR